MIIYILVGLISYCTSINCFISFYSNKSQKTWTTPENDVLVRLLFGGKNISRINNLKGGFIWLIGALVCTVLFFRCL